MGASPPVSILTASIGLGIYVPALLIERRMTALGVRPEVEVLEAYYTSGARDRQERNQEAFRRDFALAVMAHRMARSVDDCLDREQIDRLLRRWSDEGRTHFMVWSGFWLPILERYRQLRGRAIDMDCCRIDAQVSASFRAHEQLARDAREIWLWNEAEQRTLYEIPVDDRPPLPFAARERRLVVHGGGWGLGGYRDAHECLAGAGFGCDLVVHDRGEAARARHGDRCFRIDPGWRAWRRRGDRHGFPPFAELDRAPASVDTHALYEVVRRARAIVSKPGGGTLIDSLAAATPVVLLDPCGAAEASNGALWERLGFGVPLAKWRASGWSEALLAELHANLVERKRGPEYPQAYVERVTAGASA